MFSKQFSTKRISLNGKRIFVLVGGSGALGRAIVASAPQDVFFFNISRQTVLEGGAVENICADLREGLPPIVVSLQKMTSQVDVLINLAYTKTFTSVSNLETSRFLDEIYIDVAVPVELGVLFGKHFWATATQEENKKARRKVISISSLAGFGKTARPELATYSASKSALNAITPYLHDHLSQSYGVSAHIIAPGSLRDDATLRESVAKIWDLVETDVPEYTVSKIP